MKGRKMARLVFVIEERRGKQGSRSRKRGKKEEGKEEEEREVCRS